MLTAPLLNASLVAEPVQPAGFVVSVHVEDDMLVVRVDGQPIGTPRDIGNLLLYLADTELTEAGFVRTGEWDSERVLTAPAALAIAGVMRRDRHRHASR